MKNRDGKMMDEDGRMNVRSLLFTGLIALSVAAWAPFAWGQTGANPGAKQVDWPATHAGRWGEAFFEAYNADAEDALRGFIKEHYSEEYLKETPIEQELANGPLMLRGVVGRVAVHSASAEGDFKIEAVVKTEKFGWAKFRIELSPEPPHDLIGMGPYATARPPVEATSDKWTPLGDDTEAYHHWKDLRDLLEQGRRDSGAPGMAAAIVHRGKIVDKAVIGVRRFDRPDPVKLADRWHIGSVSKTFTGTMIAKLIEDGALRWDMTIGEVLRDIPMQTEYRSITLEQLLGHRGGVPSVPSSGEFAVGSSVDSGRSPAKARAALVRLVLSEKPDGIGEYVYSNSGYVVAAYMAERVAKRPWEELMGTLVFEPLKLRSTGFGWPATEDHPNQPHGHYDVAPNLRVQELGKYELLDMDAFGPAANLHCSIEDFASYAAFHLRVLNDRDSTLKAEIIPRFWKEGKTDDGERRYGFFGSGGTFMAMIIVYPDSDLAIVAATNYGLPAMSYLKKMRDAIHRRMTGASGASYTDDEPE
jgi:CubicO group peptidase (beta-lactamase class C family)